MGERTGQLNTCLNFIQGPHWWNFEKVKQTDWMDLKTEALDINSEFIWLDDYPFEAEKKVLNKFNRIDALIVVDLKRESELKESSE